jgi:hypothetical protein
MTTRARVAVAVAGAALLALIVGSGTGSAAVAAKAPPNAMAHHVGAAGAAPAATTYTQTLEFSNAFDTHIFTVLIAAGGNMFTASSTDCCIAGDHWGMVVDRFGGVPTGKSNPIVAACGTGSTTAPSGFATLKGNSLAKKTLQVVVIHCSGVSTFPADLTIFFSSNVNITVTEKT